MIIRTMTVMAQEWPNRNGSLGSRVSAETDGQESARNGLAAYPGSWHGRGEKTGVLADVGRPPGSAKFHMPVRGVIRSRFAGTSTSLANEVLE